MRLISQKIQLNIGGNRNKGLNEGISNRQKDHYINEQESKNVYKVAEPIDFKQKNMRIIFEYYFNETKKEFIPTCDSEFKGDYIPLVSYLNGDLGDKIEYKEFPKDILNILISNREEDISSNSQGVDVVGDNVYIFFLCDSDNKQYQVKLPKVEFTSIIRRWIGFSNRSIEDPNYQEVIDSEDVYK